MSLVPWVACTTVYLLFMNANKAHRNAYTTNSVCIGVCWRKFRRTSQEVIQLFRVTDDVFHSPQSQWRRNPNRNAKKEMELMEHVYTVTPLTDEQADALTDSLPPPMYGCEWLLTECDYSKKLQDLFFQRIQEFIWTCLALTSSPQLTASVFLSSSVCVFPFVFLSGVTQNV